MQIIKTNHIPRYLQLKQLLLREIKTRRLKPGALVPSEPQLCAKYGISRITVGRAMADLVNAGILYREAGKGTYVSDRSKIRRNRCGTIGLYLMSLAVKLTATEAPTHYAIVHGINGVASARGWHTLLMDNQTIKMKTNKVMEAGVDGLIISGAHFGSKVDRFVVRLRDENIPYVMMGRASLREDLNYVEEYSAGEIFKATNYLLKLGHRRIAVIGRGSDELIYRNFFDGYRKAMVARELYDPQREFRTDDYAPEAMARTVRELFRQGNPPTAVFSFHQKFLGQLLHAFKANRIRVPEDVSLLTAGNRQVESNGMRITTVGGVIPEQYGKTAALALLGLIEGNISPPVNIKMPLRIIAGDTCRRIG